MGGWQGTGDERRRERDEKGRMKDAEDEVGKEG